MPPAHRHLFCGHLENPWKPAVGAQQPIDGLWLQIRGPDGLLPRQRRRLPFDFRPESHTQTTSGMGSILRDGCPGRLESVSYRKTISAECNTVT